MIVNILSKQTGLIVTSGKEYGACGNGFLCMNIACPRVRLQEGLHFLKKGISVYLQK